MKFLARVRKHPELVFFIFSYLAFLVFVMGNVSPKYLLWHALPKPPEPIEKLFFVSGDSVAVTSTYGNKFSCNIRDMTKCWVVDSHKREEWLPQCGEELMSLSPELLSSKHTVQTAQDCGFAHNYAEFVTAYSLNDDGLVYVKQLGWVTLSGYYWGAIFSTIGTVLFFLSETCHSRSRFRVPKRFMSEREEQTHFKHRSLTKRAPDGWDSTRF